MGHKPGNTKLTSGQKPPGRSRARRADEKEDRRQGILEGALSLFETRGFARVSMAELALEAGLAKGTIYLYFNTKEEIFLELAERRLLAWFEAVDEGLRVPTGGLFPEPLGPEAVSTLVVESLLAQPGLGRLLAILHTVLEQNVDRAAALRFKTFLADRCLRTGRLLEHRLPFLGEGEGAGLLLRIHALVLGCWQMSDPPPQVRELFQAPGLEIFDVPFRPFFETTLQALIRGLAPDNRSRP